MSNSFMGISRFIKSDVQISSLFRITHKLCICKLTGIENPIPSYIGLFIRKDWQAIFENGSRDDTF
jgi:hypothetical protein